MMSYNVKTEKKSILLRLLIVAFCAYMLISLASLYYDLADSREQLTEVQTEVEETASRIEEQTNLLENSTQEELIEKAARERLG